jgi:hypothetical protein
MRLWFCADVSGLNSRIFFFTKLNGQIHFTYIEIDRNVLPAINYWERRTSVRSLASNSSAKFITDRGILKKTETWAANGGLGKLIFNKSCVGLPSRVSCFIQSV